MLVLIGGKARAGKDTAADVIKYILFEVIHSRKFSLAEHLKKKCNVTGMTKEEARDTWIDYGDTARKLIGKKVFTDIVKAKILDDMIAADLRWNRCLYIIPDVRYPDELMNLSKTRKVFSIYIDSSEEERRKRFDSEKEADLYFNGAGKGHSENSVCKDDFDCVITNNVSMEEFRLEIAKWIIKELPVNGLN